MLSLIQRYLTRTVIISAQIFFVVFFVRLFLFDIGKIDGQSMETQMIDRQVFLVNRFVYFARPPRRYEIIQFFHPNQPYDLLVKRVVGLPGEILRIKRGVIYIETLAGEEFLIQEPYLAAGIFTDVKPGLLDYMIIPPHSYFVIGDNRLFSGDSREFGAVGRQYITGKVFSL